MASVLSPVRSGIDPIVPAPVTATSTRCEPGGPGSDCQLTSVADGWQAVAMRTYAQYCPIARASELLGERWSVIILRNILVGCQTFNEIAEGAPGLSRGLLSKRLKERERAGVIEIRPKPDRPGSFYEPTEAGRGLAEVLLAL